MGREYVNRVAFFYTLRWLWKKEGHVVDDDLYVTLGISRTRYDQILRNDEKTNLKNLLKDLSDRTGLHENYISGKTSLGFREVSGDMWINYVANRKRTGEGKKTVALMDAERVLEKALTSEFAGNGQKDPLKQLMHFARFKCKRDEIVIAKRLEQIGNAMEQLGRTELEQLELDTLTQYRSRLRVHLDHVAAICVLKGWEGK